MKGQGPADTTLLASLQQARATKQAVLEQGSVVSQLEGDFNTVLSPIMESCTKDDIAVFILMKLGKRFVENVHLIFNEQ